MIDAFASLPHYLAHLLPVWRALPEDQRGTLYVARLAAATAVRANVDHFRSERPPRERLTLTAGWKDSSRVPRAILVEHGAGQWYTDVDHAAYPGGPDRDNIELFICPSQRVVDKNVDRYPQAVGIAVGCPRLDHALSSNVRTERDDWSGARPAGRDIGGSRPAVAFTWHWDLGLCPETRPAWSYYRDTLADTVAALHANEIDVVGHAHPRARPSVWSWYEHHNVPIVQNIDDLYDLADLIVADNTSAMYEAAALHIPSVALNQPLYRKDVDHGLRFWDAIPGLECDTPEDLTDTILTALDDPIEAIKAREYAVEYTYAHTDGRSAERAAAAILDLDHG